MNVPPQFPSSEEPTQVPVHHSSEETLVQPLPAAALSEEETIKQPPVNVASEDIPAEETTEQSPVNVASEDIPAEETTEQPLVEEPTVVSHESLAEETEQPLASSSELDGTEISTDEDGEDDDIEAFESDLPGSSVAQSSQGGVFIHKGWLIGVISAVVVVALLATLLVFVSRPKDPPTDWIATYTPPAGTSTSGKVLYYLHWTNQNGDLKGQLQLAANPSGTLQSLTVPAVGLYNKDNHIIYVVITINGQADTLTGKINDANDTLNLNAAGTTSQSGLLVFHTGSADDYKQATKNLGAKKA